MRHLFVLLIIMVISAAHFTKAFAQAPVPFKYSSAPLLTEESNENQVARLPETPTAAMTGKSFPHFFAPLGVHGAQVIKPGKWLVAYSYHHVAKDGNLVGTGSVSTSQLLRRYPCVPESMAANIHGICLRRGITKKLTLMAMIPYLFKKCHMVTRNGTHFTVESQGIGDLQLAGSYLLYRSTGHQLVFYGGVSAPTGSINVRDDTPTKANAKLGYGMQLGSGTVDLHPALIYMGRWDRVYWGAQLAGVLRLGRNYNDYRWGNSYTITGWTGYRLFDSLLGSLRLDWQSWGNIHGADPKLNPKISPGKDPELRGGSRLDILPGLNWYINQGPLKGNRLFIEGDVPLYQNLDGPQAESAWALSVGWKCIFG